MSLRTKARYVLFVLLACVVAGAVPADAQEGTTRVTGRVIDEANAIPLPGIPVEVVGSSQVVYSDMDGRYMVQLPAGTHELKVAMEGYQPESIRVTVAGQRAITVDVSLTMSRFAETVTVTASFVTAETSSATAQLIERKHAQVITDNIGSQEMRQNGDSDAASAMARVTGMSVVDNQFVFVRGLGERYSNTTLSGAVIPTTEPDKKVVPLDLFPSGLLDSIQVNKSYTPDRSAEFAGGLVQIVPTKLPQRPIMDLSYGVNYYATATGQDILLSPLGSRDWLGYDNGARALPSAFPTGKIVRRGLFTPDVGYSPEEITALGRLLENRWVPETASGTPGQNWSVSLGNRVGRLGFIASATHAYREQYVEERRRFFRVGDDDALDATNDYEIQTGTQRAQLGLVGNIAVEVTPANRLSFENFYSHSGRDEGRYFEGPNLDNQRFYRNYRLQFIEEGLLSNAVGGDHFFQNLGNSRFDWRVTFARARRDEPDLRETYYEATLPLSATPVFTLADESQSGFRQFSNLDDETMDIAANWSVYGTMGGRPSQIKVGLSHVDRTREFVSRRFRFIPITLNKDGQPVANQRLSQEELYTSANIGTAFRFNEETTPRDAYDGEQQTTSGYGMLDVAFTGSTRLVAGARVERFNQTVTTLDPFGLFARTLTAENENTDVFPAANLVQALRSNMNLRLSYSATVNRPEFRELAEFEFTDVVGNRATRGNPDLDRALIQNVDGRWETFLGNRGILAASAFYKHFDQPIERVVLASAQPIVTFQNADSARNFGIELEAGHQVTSNVFLSANYTFVDSKITLRPEQRTVQTSLERALAGQSRNLFNMTGEFTAAGFGARVLVNYAGDRISDVGSNEAPDIIEEGRATVDLVFSQRIGRMGLRFTIDNLTDSEYLFTQGAEEQRAYKLGRAFGLSLSYSLF
jgi:hypothetical protein